MQVILYKNSAPPNKVSKTTEGGQLTHTTDFHNCIFTQKNALDILHPSVLLDMNTDIGDVRKFNYMYIPKFSPAMLMKLNCPLWATPSAPALKKRTQLVLLTVT